MNPMQVGLGMSLGSVDTQFSQGALEATGVTTDLAIQGDGFFVIKRGDQRMYTRSGAFHFDADGRLVNGDGLAVQGWMNNVTSSSNQVTSLLGDIILDPNLVSSAVATQNIWLSGNLNAGLTPKTEVWKSGDALTTVVNGETVAATETTELNDLSQVSASSPLQDGDTIEIVGTDSDGNEVTGTFTYGSANDGTTLGDLLAVINDAYSGFATATLEDGKIVLTDNQSGDSSTTISLVAGASNAGEISLPLFSNTVAGFTGTTSLSAVVYDSLGGSHTVVIEFTKTENEGEWTWEVSTSGGETIVNGGTGRATFDSEGNLTSFGYDAGANSLVIDPGNGAATMHINLHGAGGNGYTGLSQYDSVSNVVVRDQDGRSTGSLTGITIDADGSIIGSFSNGENIALAQIAVAHFTNPSGLIKSGEGLYKSSAGSGEAVIERPGPDMESTLVSGALEMSNVDLAKEFTEMITAQKGFQASARVISTADQILEEVIRLKR